MWTGIMCQTKDVCYPKRSDGVQKKQGDITIVAHHSIVNVIGLPVNVMAIVVVFKSIAGTIAAVGRCRTASVWAGSMLRSRRIAEGQGSSDWSSRPERERGGARSDDHVDVDAHPDR